MKEKPYTGERCVLSSAWRGMFSKLLQERKIDIPKPQIQSGLAAFMRKPK
jgi:hypothetical protein